MSEVRPGENDLPAPIGVAPPITSDPPFHALARRLLLPAFAPKPIAALEPFTRELCNELLDAIEGKDEFDAAVEYAQHIPVRRHRADARLPRRKTPTSSASSSSMILEDVDMTAEERAGASRTRASSTTYLDARIDEHIANPRDDLTTFLLEAELDGNKLHPDHVRGTMVLLMVAGIDTTWSAIGASLWHLAQNPDDRKRLAAEPALMDTAVEEFLRAYAPVTMARLVAKDFDFNGCPMKEGDWVLLPFPAANRDPELFPDADEVHHRPRREPPRRVRPRHPPLPRLEPRPHGAAGRARGVDEALPRLRARRSRRGHVVRRPGPRPAHDPGSHPVEGHLQSELSVP